jgi:serine phosphatase RsbU (regulator of sigma subunit)
VVNITEKSALRNAREPSDRGSETELQTCVQEQSVVFEQAVALIERLESAAHQRELGNPDCVAQLQRQLQLVVDAQQKVSAAHSRFTQTKGTLTAELRITLSRHEDLLKTLIQRIDHLQQTFEKIRSELIPKLDVESRRKNMQAAYQQSLRTV